MTNLNAQRKRAGGADGGQWQDVTVQKNESFLWTEHTMGIVKMPETIMYWQRKWLINVPSFGQVMSRNRFFRHVSNDAVVIAPGQPGYDKLHKIKPLLELRFFPNFERTYNLHKNISVDECMIPWRERLSSGNLLPINLFGLA